MLEVCLSYARHKTTKKNFVQKKISNPQTLILPRGVFFTGFSSTHFNFDPFYFFLLFLRFFEGFFKYLGPAFGSAYSGVPSCNTCWYCAYWEHPHFPDLFNNLLNYRVLMAFALLLAIFLVSKVVGSYECRVHSIGDFFSISKLKATSHCL